MFLSWWGAFLLGALDSTLIFFLPLGVDALVIYLSARHSDTFWIYPLAATAGSIAGAAMTFWIGKKVGEVGLERLVDRRRLERLRQRVRKQGAIAMAIPALLPPPFPLTPFVLTSGALRVDGRRLLITFSAARLLRFGTEAILAQHYGRSILTVLESTTFQWVVAGFIAVAVGGSVISAMVLWRSTRRPMPA